MEASYAKFGEEDDITGELHAIELGSEVSDEESDQDGLEEYSEGDPDVISEKLVGS